MDAHSIFIKSIWKSENSISSYKQSIIIALCQVDIIELFAYNLYILPFGLGFLLSICVRDESPFSVCVCIRERARK